VCVCVCVCVCVEVDVVYWYCGKMAELMPLGCWFE